MSLLSHINLSSMSRKVDAFRLLVQQPLTKRDFLMFSPQLIQASIIVQSMTFPTERLRSVEVFRRGYRVELPTMFEIPGDWTFEVPESTLTAMRLDLMSVMYKRSVFDVYLFLGSLFNSLNLNSLNSIASILSNAAAIITTAQTLGSCWIREIAPVDFAASDPETPITWRVTVHYNYIRALVGAL